MALAFQYMRKKAIKYASDDTIEALAKDYANIMKDAYSYLSKANKGNKNAKGKPSWNKGKHLSEEHKKSISKANKGKNKCKHWKIVNGKRVYY